MILNVNWQPFTANMIGLYHFKEFFSTKGVKIKKQKNVKKIL